MKNKINVLHVGPLPPPYSGLNVSLKNFLDSESIKKCNNFVYNTSTEVTPGKSYKLKLPTFSRIFRHLNIAVKIFKEIKKNNIDILHFQGSSHDLSFIGNWISILVAKIHGVRVVWHIHDDLSDKKVMFPGNKLITQLIFKLLIRSSDVIATLSNKSKKIIEVLDNKTNIEVIPPCVKIASNIELQSNKDNFSILFVGWLVKDKGIFDLLKISELIRAYQIDVQFIVLGTGMSEIETKQVNEEIKKLNLENIVQLKGVVIGEEKEKYFREASILIHPTYWDAFPLVIIEAMAFGLPIITTKVGGIPEIIGQDGGAIFHEPGDIEGMVKSIIFLKENEHIRAKICQSNRKRFEAVFHLEKIAEHTVDIYYKILGKF